MEHDWILVKGAREHNLKNIEIRIPRERLVVITGLSGSGKSSLAFDTLYAEGQRRYVESLSAYARQFLEQLQKPDVDAIDGLSPAIAIEQKTTTRNPRSTVGTITEIYDYLRLLYSRVGRVECYQCGRPIAAQSVQEMTERVLALAEGTRLMVLAPIVRDRKGEYRRELDQLRREGFLRIRVDGRIRDLSEDIQLERHRRHTLEVVVDQLILRKEREPVVRRRLTEALEYSLNRTGGWAVVHLLGKEDLLFSGRLACAVCGISYPEISPRSFSFNSPLGACSSCEGLGVEVPEGEEGEDPEAWVEGRIQVCRTCGGARLRRESLSVRLYSRDGGGLRGANIAQLSQMSLRGLVVFLEHLALTPTQKEIARRILKEILERLRFLLAVGVDYLSLDRPAVTLSGGESQRIRLATQIGSGLTGVLYVLDEPSIGLHFRDHQRLLSTLRRLRDMGNTVLVVEHDEETIRTADYVVDMGPGAGVQGGRVVAAGTPREIMDHPGSLTGQYLSGRKRIALPPRQHHPTGKLVIRGAREHNLKGIDVEIPLGLLVCVTGVSGSGKSTLVFDVLYRHLLRHLHRTPIQPGACKGIEGMDQIDKVIHVDQGPIGRTPRSNPATYTGVFTEIRNLYAQLPESRIRGYRPGRFSFNVKGGRCEACQGEGWIKVEMHFLPDVYVTCEVCKGRRYNEETLSVRYRGRSIADVLEMTVAEALEFFSAIPSVAQRLQVLQDVGLDYLPLGQPATTLSGGEAQRIKLSRALVRKATGRTLYLLDEPTTGLHFADIQRLLEVLHRLVEAGNTVVVIEHQLDVIRHADWIIDLGPEGGEEGGEVVACGPPEAICHAPRSYTGQALKRLLARERRGTGSWPT